MRTMLAVSAGVVLLLTASGAGQAGSRARIQSAGSADVTNDTAKDRTKNKEPSSFNKTFQWEEKVVGPKDKSVNRDRIAAMQEQGRREDAAKRHESSKTPTRTEGVNGPASAVIPTQDIEKPAPVSSVRNPVRRASYASPKQHDAIDDVLAENSASDEPSGRAGLRRVIGGSSRSHRASKHAKHGRRRRR
jgi:hypothetical protein